MTATKKITLQANYGSHAQVVRVYAYDTWTGRALVKLLGPDGDHAIDALAVSDLEALHDDEPRTFADVRAVLEARAGEVLRHGS